MTRPLETVDLRLVALIRVILAFAAFFFTYLDPAGPAGLDRAVYAALTLYILYSGAFYLATARRARFVPPGAAYWVDIGWYVLFVALGGGTNSVYFFFFFFAVLVASFRFGFGAGLRAAAASAALFTVVGYFSSGAEDFQLSRFLLRPTYLLALGYLIAYWGGMELKLRRQLELLKDVTVTLNARFGTEHLVGHVVRMLREFYDARVCLLILSEGVDGGGCLIFRAEAGSPPGAAAPFERVPCERLRALMRQDDRQVLARSRGRRRVWGRGGGGTEAFDADTQEPVVAAPGEFDSVARALGAESLLSVPVGFDRGMSGRYYVIDAARKIGRGDADFVIQVFEHVKPFVENVRLVDTLATGAAEEERQKIARDIHDGVIQPYIGLQLGLEALRRQAAGHEEVAGSVARLLALTESGIEDLRQFVGGLKTGGVRRGSLLPALRRFGSKFSAATGIAVTVESEAPDLFLNDQLAAEVFQMVTEALSNIRRHTEARAAHVRVGYAGKEFYLRVSNAGAGGDAAAAAFKPRSISERAASLGGTATVSRPPEGGAVVEVKIPL